VTVVYAEMPRFAQSLGNGVSPATTEQLPGVPVVSPVSGDVVPRPAGRIGRFARAFIASRVTWFAFGALAGVVGALALALWFDRVQVREPQTLSVGPDGTASFDTIAAAMAEARSGDTVRLEPGTYTELVQISSGVDFVARVPGTVTIARPAAARPSIPTVTATGDRNVRISGIRIHNPTDTPADVALRISSPAATLELAEIGGAVQQAISLSPVASVTMRGGRIAVTGRIVSVGDDGHATFLNNVLTRIGPGTDAAIHASSAAHLTLRGNAFSGFGTQIIAGVPEARRRELLDDNIVVPPARSR
jgi:hypothetical protein